MRGGRCISLKAGPIRFVGFDCGLGWFGSGLHSLEVVVVVVKVSSLYRLSNSWS